MPTVTTGAVVSGATTTSSPLASLVLSIPIWSRFTRCPLSSLLLVSLPRNPFPIRPTYQEYLVRGRALPDGSALHTHAQILAAILEVRPNAPAPLCNLRERADPSTPLVAPAFQNSPKPGASAAATRARLRSASSPARRVTAWLLPLPRAHDRRPSPLPRDTRASCSPRCAPAILQAIARSAGPLAPPASPLPS